MGIFLTNIFQSFQGSQTPKSKSYLLWDRTPWICSYIKWNEAKIRQICYNWVTGLCSFCLLIYIVVVSSWVLHPSDNPTHIVDHPHQNITRTTASPTPQHHTYGEPYMLLRFALYEMIVVGTQCCLVKIKNVMMCLWDLVSSYRTGRVMPRPTIAVL